MAPVVPLIVSDHEFDDLDADNDIDIGDSPTAPADADGCAGNGASPDDPDAPIENNALLSKTKRIACTICRRRKLKCNGTRPSCSTCTRLGHSCAYDEVRRKSGPKRGYVKALEERLRQVETMLKTRDAPEEEAPSGAPAPAQTQQSRPQQSQQQPRNAATAAATTNFGIVTPPMGLGSSNDMDRWLFNPESPQPAPADDIGFVPNVQLSEMNNFTWEMIGLGLKEPLPVQEVIDELHHIYFTKVHPTAPMIHRARYLAAMDLAPNQRPPVALRYAMWTHACAISDGYGHFQDLFYKRARQYVEVDASRGYGEHIVSVAMAQTYILLTLYEFRMMYFPRAWMSTGSAVRLCQMMGLHRIDGAALEVKACAPPPRDWTEREERRRTFWMAFCMDKYASIGTGWPMTIDERDVTTHLAASESAFELSRPEQTLSLPDSLAPSGAGKLSSFGSTALTACLFGRNLTHLHRPEPEDNDHDLNGAFWKRHRQLDNILLSTTLGIPPQLRLPEGLSNPNVVWTAMCFHTSTICLHQAAIFKADKNRLPANISAESKMRCIASANETASIMRMISHIDTSASNPFMAFSLYVAARVFVQYLKSRPDDSQTIDTLSFLLTAMAALKRRNPFTESFLVQLDVDVDSLVAKAPGLRSKFCRNADQETYERFTERGKFHQADNDFGGTRSCNHMSLGDDLPDLTPGYHPSASAPQNMGAIPYESVERANVGGGYGSASGGSRSGSASAGGNGLHDDAGGPMSDTTPSNRPTPNSSAASDHRCSSVSYTGPGAQLSPGSRSFNASPASSHHNLAAGMDPGSTQGFFPQISQIPVFGHPSNLGGDVPDPTLLSPGRNLGSGIGQNVQMRAGGHPHAQMPTRIQREDADFAWMRELAESQSGLNAAAGLIGMGSLDQIDMSAWDAAI